MNNIDIINKACKEAKASEYVRELFIEAIRDFTSLKIISMSYSPEDELWFFILKGPWSEAKLFHDALEDIDARDCSEILYIYKNHPRYQDHDITLITCER